MQIYVIGIGQCGTSVAFDLASELTGSAKPKAVQPVAQEGGSAPSGNDLPQRLNNDLSRTPTLRTRISAWLDRLVGSQPASKAFVPPRIAIINGNPGSVRQLPNLAANLKVLGLGDWRNGCANGLVGEAVARAELPTASLRQSLGLDDSGNLEGGPFPVAVFLVVSSGGGATGSGGGVHLVQSDALVPWDAGAGKGGAAMRTLVTNAIVLPSIQADNLRYAVNAGRALARHGQMITAGGGEDGKRERPSSLMLFSNPRHGGDMPAQQRLNDYLAALTVRFTNFSRPSSVAGIARGLDPRELRFLRGKTCVVAMSDLQGPRWSECDPALELVKQAFSDLYEGDAGKPRGLSVERGLGDTDGDAMSVLSNVREAMVVIGMPPKFDARLSVNGIADGLKEFAPHLSDIRTFAYGAAQGLELTVFLRYRSMDACPLAMHFVRTYLGDSWVADAETLPETEHIRRRAEDDTDYAGTFEEIAEDVEELAGVLEFDYQVKLGRFSQQAGRSSAAYPLIPYGQAVFKHIQREGKLYVDKTRFIRQLERERHVFLIRPRRFGKSLFLSALESYYDRRQADDFEAVFANTDIGRQPTAERSRYVILRFNFSVLNDKLETLEDEFQEYCFDQVRATVEGNADLFAEEPMRRILSPSSINLCLNELFRYAGERDIPVYVLIDEYDNFANTIMAHRGVDAYQSFTHGGGFYRTFFATLKAGTEFGSLRRMFITGVSPVTMDDVTSGFNIGKNISLLPEYNELLGFTEADVRDLLSTYHKAGALALDVDMALDVMRDWYDGYRFAKAANETMYNTDMVLYFLDAAVPNKPMPEDLIDPNVRIDYSKLRHLLVVGRQLNGNFDLLRHLIGEGSADTRLVSSFPLERLGQRENFLSLMHYFGLLSIRADSGNVPSLGIPNQTVRQLMYGYLRDAYRDTGVFSVDIYEFERLTRAMAGEGDWRPVIKRLSTLVAEQTSIRDYIQGEKVIQSFLAAYLCTSNSFVLHTEMELNKGYADMVLAPMHGLRHGYVIEVKYLKRDAADEAKPAAALRKAIGQLHGYLADTRLVASHPDVRFTGVALVFRGWELVHAEAVEGAS